MWRLRLVSLSVAVLLTTVWNILLIKHYEGRKEMFEMFTKATLKARIFVYCRLCEWSPTLSRLPFTTLMLKTELFRLLKSQLIWKLFIPKMRRFVKVEKYTSRTTVVLVSLFVSNVQCVNSFVAVVFSYILIQNQLVFCEYLKFLKYLIVWAV